LVGQLQGRSGLGIEAQREALARLAKEARCEIASEFVEVETGKGSNALDRRPQLVAPLPKARPRAARSPSPSSIGFPVTCISYPA
jgi:DNA invertase Pin-like site-specific DNA recombinase